MSFLDKFNPLSKHSFLNDSIGGLPSVRQGTLYPLGMDSKVTHGNNTQKKAQQNHANAAAILAGFAPMQPPPVSGNPAYGPGRPDNQMFGLGPYNDLALRLSYGGQVPQGPMGAQAGPLGGGMMGGPLPGFGGSGPPPQLLAMLAQHQQGMPPPTPVMPPGQGAVPPNPFMTQPRMWA